MPSKVRKLSAPSSSSSFSPATDATPVPAPDAWADDDDAPFPRGGGAGTALSALEYQAIARAAKRDAAEEQPEGTVESERNGKGAATALATSGPVRAYTLSHKQMAPGVKALAAVSDVSSSRLLVQLPDRMVGRISRAEVSDELHALCQTDGDLPDLRKLFKVGEVLLCAVIPLASHQITRSASGRVLAAVELSLRLTVVQAPALNATAKLRVGSLLWATPGSKQASKHASAAPRLQPLPPYLRTCSAIDLSRPDSISFDLTS
ncbi:MAG: hypothetical protein SGPRY_002377 [Prymnesium sp.]